jgi:two-component system heavy metal sensor histidine kinase CusS
MKAMPVRARPGAALAPNHCIVRSTTNPRSIASQLVLFFTLAAALLLFCGLGAFYWIVVRHAFAEDNAVMADKISALTANFNESGPQLFGEELKASHAHAPYWVRVLDSDGRTLSEAPGMDRLVPPNIFPPPLTLPQSSPAPQLFTDYRAAEKLFSLVAVQAESGGKTYTIQVAQDRTSDEQLQRNFGLLLLAVLAAGVLVSALVARLVTRRGLRPLWQFAGTVQRIDPNHLNQRVAPAGWPRELQPLANAFDQMLGRLEDSFARLSQFSADLAHELRTPIGNILGEAQVALTRERAPDEYREVLASTIAECERLSKIVDNLLFVARADAAREPIERKRFDGRVAIEKIAAFYRTLAEERRVTIECAGQGQVYADPLLFERAVSNLVDNALRFIPASREGAVQITIAATQADSQVIVRDNGCGIAPEHLPRVFDRFYRADPSRSAAGAGLGLALVQSIVDLHGGSATVQSELGRGTTVTLRFPGKL